MLERAFFLFSLLSIVFSCNSENIKPDEPPVVIEEEIPDTDPAPLMGMCIFYGQAEKFSENDWQILADSPVRDFVIIPKATTEYGNSEERYINELAPFMADVVNQLVSRDEDVKVWIGTPGLTSLNFNLAASSLEPFYNYFLQVKKLVGDGIWENNIGIYMNEEAAYGAIDMDNPLGNPCIKLMVDLSHKVHTNLNCEFLWIPYYGFGDYADLVLKGLSYVTNASTVFDYVVIQPHYYFDADIPKNIDYVRQSIINQAITLRDGTILVPKNSKTIIGPEMELSWRITGKNDYQDSKDRYQKYLDAFSEFAGKYPVIFYWDGTLKDALNDCIIPFF